MESEEEKEEREQVLDRNQWLNSDACDTVEFEHHVSWDKVEEARYCLQNVDTHSEWHHFKGGMFSLLVRFSRHGLSVFVGLNDINTLPRGYILNCQYTICLGMIDRESKETNWRVLVNSTHCYSVPLDPTRLVEDYTDSGRNNVEPLHSILGHKEKLVDENNCLRFRCTLLGKPLPPVLSPGYDSKRETGLVGLENLGATCYLNSLLQMLYHINAFRLAVYQTPFHEEELSSSITLAMQSVFSQLQTSSQTVSTSDLTRAFGWNSLEALQQQDVQEMLRVLLDKLEERMQKKGSEGENILKGLFAGKIKSYIRCINVDYESSREEEFYDIQLDVKNCKNVYDSFRKYSEKELLTGENQYDAGDSKDEDGNSRGKQDAEKGVVFTQLPPVLTIHLKRFEFDMQRMGFAKIHDRYEFPARLELDEFVERPNAEQSETAVENNFILHSVLVHAGDVYGGHYYAYIRPSGGTYWENVINTGDGSQGQGGLWYKFDDDFVSLVDRRLAIDGSYGSGGADDRSLSNFHSAYMLVYIRESEASRIMSEVSIPSALATRLDEEQRLAMEAERLRENQLYFREERYLIRKDLDKFEEYSISSDTFDEYDLRTIKIMKKSSLAGYLTAFAEELGMRVDQVRLWNIRINEEEAVFRIDELLDISHCEFSPMTSRSKVGYYVELLDSIEDPVLEERLTNLASFQKSWLQECREALELHDGKRNYDRMRGCGACRGNLPLVKQLPDGEVKQNLLQDNANMDEFLVNALKESRVYEENVGNTLLLVIKVLNVDHNGSIIPPVLLETVDVQTMDSKAVTFRDIKEDCFRFLRQEADRRYSSSNASKGEKEAFEELWKSNELLLMKSSINIDRIPKKAYNYPIDSCPLDVACGDVICLIPSDVSAQEDDVESSFQHDLTLRLRSIALKIEMRVSHRRKLNVPHLDLLNRNTGLWLLARQVLLSAGIECEEDEILAKDGRDVTMNEDFCAEEIVDVINKELGFGDPQRLRVGCLEEDCHSQRKLFRVVRDDYFRRTRQQDKLHVEALPFPRKPLDGSSDHDDSKYYEVFVVGSMLKTHRMQWLDEVVNPSAIELYKQQLLDLQGRDTKHHLLWHLKRVYRDIDWPEGVTPLPDEFVMEDKVYLQLKGVDHRSCTVHDVVQEFRKQMCLHKKQSTASRSHLKRSAETAGLDVHQSETGSNEESIPTNGASDESSSQRITPLTKELQKLLGCAEEFSDHDVNAKEDRMLMFNAGSKISKFYHAADLASSISLNWVDDSMHNMTSHNVTLQSLCIQAVSPHDWMMMTAASPSVRSTPIAVISYEYSTSKMSMKAQNMKSDNNIRPLISFVCEDDSLSDLVKRLSIQTGNDLAQLKSMRFAVIGTNNTFHYVDMNEDGTGPVEEDELDTAGELWHLFRRHNPAFTVLTSSTSLEGASLPTLCIQDSSVDVKPRHISTMRYLSNGIKIN